VFAVIFGPGAVGSGGANVNVLGLHMLVIAALGIYCAYTNLRAHSWALFGIVCVTILCLCGTFPWLNHNVAIWNLSQADCLSYFYKTNDADYNRCDDKGYLQLLRTFGIFAIIVLLMQAFQLLNALTSGATVAKASSAAGSRHERSSSYLPGFGQSASYHAPAPSVEPAVAPHHDGSVSVGTGVY